MRLAFPPQACLCWDARTRHRDINDFWVYLTNVPEFFFKIIMIVIILQFHPIDPNKHTPLSKNSDAHAKMKHFISTR